METHRATEIAYKNGYEKGKAEAEATIRKLTEENTRLQTDYNELYESTTEEIKSLRAELRERPPKLIITKVSKGGS